MSTSIPISGLSEMSVGQFTPDDFFPIVDSASLTTYRLPQRSLNIWFGSSGSVLSASFSSASFSSSYAKTASYAATASWAAYAVTSSYASQSSTASYALRTDFATSSSWASRSVSASFVVSASFAQRAFQAATASWAAFAVSCSFASESLSSSYAFQSVSSSFAISASYAKSASYARTASWALSSSYAFSASYARSASYSWSGSFASRATFAVTASYAFSSSYIIQTGGEGSPFLPGMILAYANQILYPNPPSGFLRCDGSPYDPLVYTTLAQIIGTSFSGVGNIDVTGIPESNDGAYHRHKDGQAIFTINGNSTYTLTWGANSPAGPFDSQSFIFNGVNGYTQTFGGFSGYSTPNYYNIYAYTMTDNLSGDSVNRSVTIYYAPHGGDTLDQYTLGNVGYLTPNLDAYFVTNFNLNPFIWIIKY